MVPPGREKGKLKGITRRELGSKASRTGRVDPVRELDGRHLAYSTSLTDTPLAGVCQVRGRAARVPIQCGQVSHPTLLLPMQVHVKISYVRFSLQEVDVAQRVATGSAVAAEELADSSMMLSLLKGGVLRVYLNRAENLPKRSRMLAGGLTRNMCAPQSCAASAVSALPFAFTLLALPAVQPSEG